MKGKNFKKYTEIVAKFLDKLMERGYEIKYLQEPSIDDPGISFRLCNSGIKKYRIGIWPCGEWSDYYETEDISRISIFLIHDWNLDKFRPSSSDIEYTLYSNSSTNVSDLESSMDTIVDCFDYIKKHSVKIQGEIVKKRNSRVRNPYINYYMTWITIKNWEVRQEIKYRLWPILVYSLLRLVSKFDPRVKYVEVFKEDALPRYTFGFLANSRCSGNNKSWQHFGTLYSRLPQKLCMGARFNVADYSNEMGEDEIKIRLFKGVVI